MPPNSGLRARKKQATFDDLCAAALRLAAVAGPDGVTVEEISEAAGVSPRTFFNYFRCKEDAILGAEPERGAALLVRLAERPADEPPLEALRVALGGLAAELADDPEAWDLRLRLVREHPSLLARYLASLVELERTLAGALAERLGTDPERDPYPALVAAAAVSATRTSLRRWHAGAHCEPIQALLDEAFACLAGGLAQPGAAGKTTRRDPSGAPFEPAP